MRTVASVLSAGVLAAIVSFSAESSAQSPTHPPSASSATTKTADYTERSVGSDQVVTFIGDELPGDVAGPYGGTIRPLPGVVRVGLIRPRTNFVAELLKSVENL